MQGNKIVLVDFDLKLYIFLQGYCWEVIPITFAIQR